ncbi:MAG: HD domain-containing protein [Vitreoscilla sp.]|nr:HD domain-containing protein [Vitreoscilla sp.]
MSTSDADSDSVNPHYLDHVVETAGKREVEASEDIIASNGMKLLAKGARIAPEVRERLLQHKLAKPLEDCVRVVDGVIPEAFGPMAEELLDQHALLAALCANERAQPVPVSLGKLRLTMPVQSLLTVYSDYQGDRLRHTVGVAMLSMALARRLFPGDVDRHRLLAFAGLVHDVGELYIDPQFLKRGARLQPEQWRHIVTHPVVGHRVLKNMEGAGREVAEAVLLHHERLDGFGYPRGVAGDRFTLNGQILAIAEWLMALIESGLTPLTRARVATQLITGEFDPALVEEVTAAAFTSDEPINTLATPAPLDDAVPRVARIVQTLHRFAKTRDWIDERIAAARGERRATLEAGVQRMLRIQMAFSSTGLNAASPEQILSELGSLQDPQLQLEVTTIVCELEWRLRELERETLQRATRAGPEALDEMRELIGRLLGTVG